MNEQREPDVIVIWTHASECHMTGAFMVSDQWRFSEWVIIPQAELTDFLEWRKTNGARVYDFRQVAETQNAGWGSVTPLIVAQNNVSMAKAVEAATTIWSAIVNDGK